jgi:hypothetical protein
VAALALLIYGTIWSYRTYAHDRLVTQERAAAERTPYTPGASTVR